MKLSIPIIWLATAGMLLTPARAEPRLAPFELTRGLQMLQENVARGSPTAQELQQKFLPQMASQFLAADPSVWGDEKNVRGLLIYCFSGGNAKVLRKIMERGNIPEANLLLARGTLAYSEGRRDEAIELLGPIDPRSLPIGFGGYIALAQAVLVADKDPKKAMQLLDFARLMMPGTLVEEAALRREIIVAVRDGDIEKFERLSRQQIMRFSKSLYAASFRHQLSDAIVKLDYGDGPGRFRALETMIAPLEPVERRELYLMIARKAVIAGRDEVARFSAAQAVRLTQLEGVKDPRADLYDAATLLVTDQYETSLKTLQGIDRVLLPKEDQALLAYALKLAAKLREWPKADGAMVPENKHEDILGGKEPSVDQSFKDMIARAGKAISGADEDLKAFAQ